MKWNEGLALAAYDSCEGRADSKSKRYDHSTGWIDLIRQRALQYGSGLGIYEVDEGLSYGGNANSPEATRAFEIVLDLLINSHDHDSSTDKKDDFLKYREGHHASTIFSPNYK
jgi:hypothetical protein